MINVVINVALFMTGHFIASYAEIYKLKIKKFTKLQIGYNPLYLQQIKDV